MSIFDHINIVTESDSDGNDEGGLRVPPKFVEPLLKELAIQRHASFLWSTDIYRNYNDYRRQAEDRLN